ncbi:hypothetical protein [Mesorhizobium sp. M7A.F.Ca.US.008.03.1.1]|uniref:hypothetical protein n=1 Tax=Mesorhizobium sp. M7A.F.Ca.US.008.03.1.1 TaxID=2496742 RepID=UPI000FC99929|nr:hypothetical protein [Mesorhizobium sp. M7A.F.Ca.US.008.03.1.1]RUW63860.1 hypothetical protein EOA16_01135 [Mesorhizobium sp. M7A.F.Ca.US.008.03.1.1]
MKAASVLLIQAYGESSSIDAAIVGNAGRIRWFDLPGVHVAKAGRWNGDLWTFRPATSSVIPAIADGVV